MSSTDMHILTARFDQMSDPTDVATYTKLAGYDGLQAATGMAETAILDELDAALLWRRDGRGEAVGKEWRDIYEAKSDTKYIICNANEGEPGSFKDKTLLQKDPMAVIEGMTIAAYLCHANQGYIYVRGEFQGLIHALEQTLTHCRAANFLGQNIMGIEGFDFDIEISRSGGAYVCDEPAAMIAAMSGNTGRGGGKVNLAKAGLFKQPTLVADPETFADVPVILRKGGQYFQELGTAQSGGTKLICLTGHFKNRGLFEVSMGTPIEDILYDADLGGGSLTGQPFKFLHFGGQSGVIVKPEDVATDDYSYETLQEDQITIGTGAIVAMTEGTSILDYLVAVSQFFMDESCGKCPACRIGTVRINEALQNLQAHKGVKGDLTRLAHMVDHVATQSSCSVGQVLANPIFSSIKAFPEEFKLAVDWNTNVVKEVPW